MEVLTQREHSERRRLVRRISIVGVLLVIGGYIGGLFPVPAGILLTGLGNPGTSIWVMVSGGLVYPSLPHLAVVSPHRIGSVEKLNDLQGCVHISDAAAALRFVRIKTSHSTWYLFDYESEAEIVTTADAFKLPTFGLQRVPQLPFPRSGLTAVLAPNDFRSGKFSPASVEAAPGGFRVTRWILDEQLQTRPYLTVQKVQEYVGKDGSYRQVVLIRKAAPEMPGVFWEFMTFD